MAQVTYIASANASATDAGGNPQPIVINKPTGTADGDLMIAHIQGSNTGVVLDSVPSGWTLLDSDTTSPSSFVYYKVASSEGATYTFTASAAGAYSAIGAITTLRNQHASPFNATSKTIGDSDTTAEGTAITPTTSPDSLLLAFIGNGGAGTVSFSAYAVADNNPSWSEAYDTNVDNGNQDSSIALAYAERDLITSTGAFSATISASAVTTVYFMSIRPAGFTFSPAALTLPVTKTADVTAGAYTPPQATLTLTPTIPSATVAQADPDFSNQTKTATTWTNQSKS